MVDHPFETFVLGTRETYSRIWSPLWFRATMPERGEISIVSDNGTISFGSDHTLPFMEGKLPAGTEVRVWFEHGRDLILCCREADWQAHLAAEEERHRQWREEAERRRQAEEAARRERHEARLREEADWLARFRPPFAWAIGHKPVMSGLLERSHGDGTNRASVTHVMLREDHASGRLSRRAGQMLCSPQHGRNGNVENGPASREEMPTCRTCLEFAARFLCEHAPEEEADPGLAPPRI